MRPQNDEHHLRTVTADIAQLDDRIRSLLAEIEAKPQNCHEVSIALKRLVVLQEYRHVLHEDKTLVLRRMTS